MLKHKADVVKQLALLPMLHCLAGQLNQGFMNLIVNASQALTDHGQRSSFWLWVPVGRPSLPAVDRPA